MVIGFTTFEPAGADRTELKVIPVDVSTAVPLFPSATIGFVASPPRPVNSPDEFVMT